MRERIRKHHISFKNAISGLNWAFTSQPNFVVHFTLSLLAVGLGIFFRLSKIEWLVLTFTIFWGLSAELINTAIESVCDLISSEWKKEIKIAKDVAAGMMLTVAIGSVVVALLLFGSRL